MIDTSSYIVKLKIKSSQVKHFPFDVIYVVHKRLKPVLSKMFPYSLCLPFNDELLSRLQKVKVHTHTTLAHSYRKDDKFAKDWTEGKKVTEFIPLARLKESFFVVPVLPRTHDKTRSQRRKDRNPAYLLAAQHRAGEHETRRGVKWAQEPRKELKEFFAFFNDFAVLFTPRGPVRPICKACPNHLEHVQGKCNLGEQKCYHSLVIAPERRSSDEQLQENGADSDPAPVSAD
jgi:hypothetical protein